MLLVRWCSFAASASLTSNNIHVPLSRSIHNTAAGLKMSSDDDAACETTPSPTSYAQHVVLRGDLLDTWGTGPMMTQAAHCSVAAIETYRHLPQTQEYLQDLDHMRKVTWQAKNEAWLEKIAARLDEAEIEYRMWIEQPENIKVGLATRPALREETEKVWKGNGIKMWR